MNSDILSVVVDGNEVFDFVNYALNFESAIDIEFRNCEILNDDILKLVNNREYNRIGFVDCVFKNVELLKYLKTKSLSISSCEIDNYDFIYDMNNLISLTIIDGKIDACKINFLEDLEYLRISNSIVENINDLILNKLKYLFIDNTNIDDVSFVQKLSKLELLSVSEDQILKNEEMINKLKNNIKIILDSIIEMEVF